MHWTFRGLHLEIGIEKLVHSLISTLCPRDLFMRPGGKSNTK